MEANQKLTVVPLGACSLPCPPCPPCSTPGDKNTQLTKVLLKANTTTSTFTIVTDFILHHSQTTLHSPGTFRDV